MRRHGDKLSKLLRTKISDPVDMLYKFSLRFMAWGGVPLALLFQSDFLGFMAVFGVFTTLGLFGCAGRFCYFLGFDSRNAFIRCQFASIILLAAAIGLHAMESSLVTLFQPLQKSVCVFGALVLYNSLLIVSSKWYGERGSKWYGDKINPSYFVRNAFMAGTLLVCHCFGNIFHMTGLQNTTSVFTVAYLWTKSAEASAELKLSTWLFAFFTSCLLWRVSLYLHAHPGLITSMFTTL